MLLHCDDFKELKRVRIGGKKDEQFVYFWGEKLHGILTEFCVAQSILLSALVTEGEG